MKFWLQVLAWGAVGAVAGWGIGSIAYGHWLGALFCALVAGYAVILLAGWQGRIKW